MSGCILELAVKPIHSEVRCCTTRMEERPWSRAESHEHDELQKRYRQQWDSKQMVHRCTESEGNIEMCQYTMGQTYHSKKLWNLYTISIWGMAFPTNLCTASSVGIFDTTHLHSHVCIHSTADIPVQVYTYKYRSGAWTCIFINSMYTSLYTGPWKHTEPTGSLRCDTRSSQYTVKRGAAPHPWRNTAAESNKRDTIIWDVILSHVGGLVSESFAYTCMAFQTTLKPYWLAMIIVRTVIWPE